MAKDMTPSALRADIYRALDRVLETGEPINISRKGRLLRISLLTPSKLAQLEPHPQCINGEAEDLIHLDWSDEWRP